MITRDFKLRNDQYRFLKKLPGTMSEHVRNAIDDYKIKKDKEKSNFASSLSVKLSKNG